MPRLILTRHANIDLAEISEWYEKQEPGLGERFFQALDGAFDRIAAEPEAYAVITDSIIRRSVVPRWPYQVFFTFREETIRVIAIIHTSRDPNHIRSRTS